MPIAKLCRSPIQSVVDAEKTSITHLQEVTEEGHGPGPGKLDSVRSQAYIFDSMLRKEVGDQGETDARDEGDGVGRHCGCQE